MKSFFRNGLLACGLLLLSSSASSDEPYGIVASTLNALNQIELSITFPTRQDSIGSDITWLEPTFRHRERERFIWAYTTDFDFQGEALEIENTDGSFTYSWVPFYLPGGWTPDQNTYFHPDNRYKFYIKGVSPAGTIYAPGTTETEYALFNSMGRTDCADCLDFDSEVLTGFAGQDTEFGFVSPTELGTALILYSDHWRATSTTYTVTPDTVLEFEFFSPPGEPGAIHGIGFDEDDAASPERIFKLHGTEPWGLQNIAEYDGYYLGNYKYFRIPVGNFYTGTNMRLVFVNDDDDVTTGGSVVSLFRNVRVFEDTTPPAALSYERRECEPDVVDFHRIAILPWPGEDSEFGGFGVPRYYDGCVLELVGNRWRAAKKTFDLFEDSILELEHATARLGDDFSPKPELSGIGFSNNGVIDQTNFFKIRGTEDFGIADYALPGEDDGLVRIPVGRHITGAGMSMVFAHDDDSLGSWDGSIFSRVRLYRGEYVPPSGSSSSSSSSSSGGGIEFTPPGGTFCAGLNEVCSVVGPREVRIAACSGSGCQMGPFSRVHTLDIPCTLEFFGMSEPIPHGENRCYTFSIPSSSSSSSSSSTTTTGSTTTSSSSSGFPSSSSGSSSTSSSSSGFPSSSSSSSNSSSTSSGSSTGSSSTSSSNSSSTSSSNSSSSTGSSSGSSSSSGGASSGSSSSSTSSSGSGSSSGSSSGGGSSSSSASSGSSGSSSSSASSSSTSSGGRVPPCQPVILGYLAKPGKVTLAWFPQRGATGYRLRYTRLSTGTDHFIDLAARPARYTFKDLVAGESYTLVVAAVNAFGSSIESSPVTVAIPRRGHDRAVLYKGGPTSGSCATSSPH